MGGAKAIITTVGNAEAVSSLMGGLALRGRLVLLGAGKDPLTVSAGHLVVGERSVLGSITGASTKMKRPSTSVCVRP
jgi:alcohol dehydrogenase